MDRLAADLWEERRQDIRGQLGDAVSEEQLERTIPSWDNLDVEARKAKVEFTIHELLEPLDRAGYEVRKKL